MTTLALSRRPSLAFSDFGSDDEEHIEINGADYSTRMGELFDDEDETSAVSVHRLDPDEDGENDEAFIYDGADAQVSSASYREQLRDVLDEDGEDTDDDDDEDGLEEREVERSLVHDLDRPPIAIEDEALVSPLPFFVPIRHACPTLISRGRTPPPLLALSRYHALVISPQPRRHFPPRPPPPPSPHHPRCPPSYQMVPPFQRPQSFPRPSCTRLPRVYAPT
jgi:hypothetical protein